jgi:sarcosine oxidase
METYDVIVLGLGAMGAATACQLAKRGVRVLGLDQYAPPHAFGSSHGDTRITRLAIGEGAHYSPLAMRSHELWRKIEAETGSRLMTNCGMLLISSSATKASVHVPHFFRNTLEAADQYGIQHQRLNADTMRAVFPQFAVQDDEVGYYEPEAGFLRPEVCIAAQLVLARKLGFQMKLETVQRFEDLGDRVQVRTREGVYEADRLVVAAGAWLPEFLPPSEQARFTVRRQVLYWFDIAKGVNPALFEPGQCPVFIWELPVEDRVIYGFPAVDGPAGGVKIATEQVGVTTTPHDVDRSVSAEEAAVTHRDCIAPFMPAVSDRLIKSTACLYTVTPDAGFVIDLHPESDRITVVSACSGHGFKHSAAIGEAVAKSVATGEALAELGPVGWDRFAV